MEGIIVVTNVHVSSLMNTTTYRIEIDLELKVSNIQFLHTIIKEIYSERFNDSDLSDFLTEMTNLQKVKIKIMEITYKDINKFRKEDSEDLFLSVDWSSEHFPDNQVVAIRNFQTVYFHWMVIN